MGALKHVDLILKNAHELITCKGSVEGVNGPELDCLECIQSGALAVDAGCIVAVGKSAVITEQYSAKQIIDCSGCLVSPGLVDPHTHLIYAGSRHEEYQSKVTGRPSSTNLASGIRYTVDQTRSADDETLVSQALKDLDVMAVHGTTTVEAKTGYGLSMDSEKRLMRLTAGLEHVVEVVPTFMGAHVLPSEYDDRRDDGHAARYKTVKAMPFPSISIVLLIGVVLFAFTGDLFYPFSPYALDKEAILMAPSAEHLLGTDRLGRDLLARLIEGGKVSLLIGVGSALAASFIGLILGATAGYLRGRVDKAFIVMVDLFLTFPTFFLLLALVSYINASVWVLIVIISITGWMTTARLIRSESFAITSQPFIKILNIAGVNRWKILLKYYAPLLAPIYFVSFTFGVGGAILAESGLSFLGLGIVAPQMSWGTILSNGKEVIDIAWWVSFFPGLMIFLITFSLMNISNYLQQLTNKKQIQSQ